MVADWIWKIEGQTLMEAKTVYKNSWFTPDFDPDSIELYWNTMLNDDGDVMKLTINANTDIFVGSNMVDQVEWADYLLEDVVVFVRFDGLWFFNYKFGLKAVVEQIKICKK